VDLHTFRRGRHSGPFPRSESNAKSATVDRTVLVIAWRTEPPLPTGPEVRVMRPGELPMIAGHERWLTIAGDDGWQAIIVRGVEADDHLCDFDTRYEMTTYPTELLWGPGSAADAVRWYATASPSGDCCVYTGRTFVLQVDGKKVFLPRSPEAAASLAPQSRGGQWHAVRADYPAAALEYARNRAGNRSAGAASASFHGAAVEEIIAGDWTKVIDHLRASLGISSALPPAPVVHVPRRWSLNMATGQRVGDGP